jgi:hypothetical protein
LLDSARRCYARDRKRAASNADDQLCDRRFVDDIARRRHLLDSTTCNAVEAILRLQFLLADRDEAVAVTRRQRDEVREAIRNVMDGKDVKGESRPANCRIASEGVVCRPAAD